MTDSTFEGLISDLEECIEDGAYFEIDSATAEVLLAGIRDLQRQADRGSRYQYPDTTGS